MRVHGVGSARLSKRKVACFVIFGAASVTLAAYSTFARTSRIFQDAQAAEFAEPQTSNRAAKTNKLLIETAFQAIKDQPVYALASADPNMNMTVERAPNPVIAATPAIPATTPAPAVEAKSAPPRLLNRNPLRSRPRRCRTKSRSACCRRRRPPLLRPRPGCSTTARSTVSRAGCD